MRNPETNQCDQCEALMINGVYCHETGCPEAWRDYKTDCAFCGFDFTPEIKDQAFCSQECADAMFT